MINYCYCWILQYADCPLQSQTFILIYNYRPKWLQLFTIYIYKVDHESNLMSRYSPKSTLSSLHSKSIQSSLSKHSNYNKCTIEISLYFETDVVLNLFAACRLLLADAIYQPTHHLNGEYDAPCNWDRCLVCLCKSKCTHAPTRIICMRFFSFNMFCCCCLSSFHFKFFRS